MSVERNLILDGDGPGEGDRHPKNRVSAEPRFVRRAVEADQFRIEQGLVRERSR